MVPTSARGLCYLAWDDSDNSIAHVDMKLASQGAGMDLGMYLCSQYVLNDRKQVRNCMKGKFFKYMLWTFISLFKGPESSSLEDLTVWSLQIEALWWRKIADNHSLHPLSFSTTATIETWDTTFLAACWRNAHMIISFDISLLLVEAWHFRMNWYVPVVVWAVINTLQYVFQYRSH